MTTIISERIRRNIDLNKGAGTGGTGENNVDEKIKVKVAKKE